MKSILRMLLYVAAFFVALFIVGVAYFMITDKKTPEQLRIEHEKAVLDSLDALASQKPSYSYKVLSTLDQPLQKTMMIDFMVDSDTIKKYGAQNVLLTLAGLECKAPCFADLWDNQSVYRLNEDNPYTRRTEGWQKKHFVSIADHLIATKLSANSDEIVKYPLIYSTDYRRWGGKLRHD